jgi:hypothetical protein
MQMTATFLWYVGVRMVVEFSKTFGLSFSLWEPKQLGVYNTDY